MRRRTGPGSLCSPPAEDTLILTHFNSAVSGDPTTCAQGGRVIHLRTPLPGGWEAGPTVAGLAFDNPAGFAPDAARRLYIADKDNRRLVRMDDVAGTGWTALTGNGSDQLSFIGRRSACFDSTYGTYDVAVDAAGRIYVASSNPQRLIRVDNMSGAGLVTLGPAGNGVGQLNQPAGMAFDPQGRIYIADEYNYRIVRVDDMTGAGWTTFGSFGTSVGHFAAPHGIDLDSRGRIYVTDTSGYRIMRIDSMDGAGWVTFANKEFVWRELILQAAKFLMPIGASPVMPYRNFFPYVPAGVDIRTSVLAVNASATPVTTTLTFQQPTAESTPTGACRGGCFTEWPVTVDGSSSSTIARGVPGRGVGTVTASVSTSTTGYAWIEAADHVAGIFLVQSLSGAAIAGQAAWAPAQPADHATIPVDNRNGVRTAYVIANPHPGGHGANRADWSNRRMVGDLHHDAARQDGDSRRRATRGHGNGNSATRVRVRAVRRSQGWLRRYDRGRHGAERPSPDRKATSWSRTVACVSSVSRIGVRSGWPIARSVCFDPLSAARVQPQISRSRLLASSTPPSASATIAIGTELARNAVSKRSSERSSPVRALS